LDENANVKAIIVSNMTSHCVGTEQVKRVRNGDKKERRDGI